MCFSFETKKKREAASSLSRFSSHDYFPPLKVCATLPFSRVIAKRVSRLSRTKLERSSNEEVESAFPFERSRLLMFFIDVFFFFFFSFFFLGEGKIFFKKKKKKKKNLRPRASCSRARLLLF